MQAGQPWIRAQDGEARVSGGAHVEATAPGGANGGGIEPPSRRIAGGATVPRAAGGRAPLSPYFLRPRGDRLEGGDGLRGAARRP
jgi:hypothetical protein